MRHVVIFLSVLASGCAGADLVAQNRALMQQQAAQPAPQPQRKSIGAAFVDAMDASNRARNLPPKKTTVCTHSLDGQTVTCVEQ